jgi:hypothetical protein
MSLTQRDTVRSILLNVKTIEPEFEFHHGDCIGADVEAHEIARGIGCGHIISHPSTLAHMRGYMVADRAAQPLPPLDRNRVIVSETDLLVAAPADFIEQRRSGTWATVRYARAMQRPALIVFISGSVLPERVATRPQLHAAVRELLENY